MSVKYCVLIFNCHIQYAAIDWSKFYHIYQMITYELGSSKHLHSCRSSFI